MSRLPFSYFPQGRNRGPVTTFCYNYLTPSLASQCWKSCPHSLVIKSFSPLIESSEGKLVQFLDQEELTPHRDFDKHRKFSSFVTECILSSEKGHTVSCMSTLRTIEIVTVSYFHLFLL